MRLAQNETTICKTRMFIFKVYVFTQARSTCAPDPRFPWGGKLRLLGAKLLRGLTFSSIAHRSRGSSAPFHSCLEILNVKKTKNRMIRKIQPLIIRFCGCVKTYLPASFRSIFFNKQRRKTSNPALSREIMATQVMLTKAYDVCLYRCVLYQITSCFNNILLASK